MATIAQLEARLDRGLAPEAMDPKHDALWFGLLGEYEAAVDAVRGTCLRKPRYPEPDAALRQTELR